MTKATPPDAPEDFDDPLGEHRRRWRWIVVSLVLVATIAAVTARPAWRAVKRYRAGNFAAQAAAFEAQSQWESAAQRAQAALQLNPAQPEALRVAAHVYDRAGNEGAVHFYETLLATPAATDADREAYVRLALRLRRLEAAGNQLELLRRAASPSARTLALAAVHQSLLGNLDAAMNLGREAIRRNPADPTNAYGLAYILSLSARPADRAESQSVLWGMARTNGPLQREALATLVPDPALNRRDLQEALDLLLKLPQPTLEDRLLASTARLALDPDRRKPLAQEVARIPAADDADLARIVEWLLAHDFAGEADLLLRGDRVRRDPRLFVARFRALEALGEGQKAYNSLFDPQAPLDAFTLEELRGRAAHKLGDAKRRETHLATAFKLAGTDPDRLVRATQLAVDIGDIPAATAVWRNLVRQPTLARVALFQLARLADLQKDTTEARDRYRELVALEPRNDAVRLAVAHRDLLLGVNLAEATAEAARQLAQSPASPRLRAIAALGYYRQGDVEKAGVTIEGTVISENDLAPDVLAILATVLEARGELDDARETLQHIRLQDLRPEEKALLRPLLLRAAPVVAPGPQE